MLTLLLQSLDAFSCLHPSHRGPLLSPPAAAPPSEMPTADAAGETRKALERVIKEGKIQLNSFKMSSDSKIGTIEKDALMTQKISEKELRDRKSVV